MVMCNISVWEKFEALRKVLKISTVNIISCGGCSLNQNKMVKAAQHFRGLHTGGWMTVKLVPVSRK